MQKFNNPVSKEVLPPQQGLQRSKTNTTPITNSGNNDLKGDDPVKFNTYKSNVESSEGVLSIKDRMKKLNEKKDAPKDNAAAKEIRDVRATSIKDAANALNSLGLFAPKIEKPIEENPGEEGEKIEGDPMKISNEEKPRTESEYNTVTKLYTLN